LIRCLIQSVLRAGSPSCGCFPMSMPNYGAGLLCCGCFPGEPLHPVRSRACQAPLSKAGPDSLPATSPRCAAAGNRCTGGSGSETKAFALPLRIKIEQEAAPAAAWQQPFRDGDDWRLPHVGINKRLSSVRVFFFTGASGLLSPLGDGLAVCRSDAPEGSRAL